MAQAPEEPPLVSSAASPEGDIDKPTEKSGEKPQPLVLAVNATPEFDLVPYNEENKSFLLMTSLKAPYFREENRAPIDLVCSVDESSSMGGERIALVKETVEFIIKNLESADRFGCIGYGTSSREILPLTKMTSEGKKVALEKVRAIRASGCTALCDGLCQALDMMRNRKAEDKNEVASVMLFTDGEANEGPTSARDIIEATLDPKYMSGGGRAGFGRRQQRRAPRQQMRRNMNRNANITANPPPPRPGNAVTNFFSGLMGRSNTQQQGSAPQIQQAPPQMQQQQMPIQQQQQQMPPQMQQQQQQMPMQQQQQMPQQLQGVPNIASQAPAHPSQIQGMPNVAPVQAIDSQVAAPAEAAETEAEEGKKDSEGAPPTKPEDTAEGELPCTINTFGFGAGHNESLLEALSEHGRGMYAFIENKGQIAETFAECLGGLVSIVGQQLRITVSSVNDVRINRCMTVGYKMTAVKPNQEYVIEIADIQSEESRDLVFELTLPKIGKMDPKWHIAKVVLNYTNVVKENKSETIECIATVGRTDVKDVGERNYDLDLQYNRLLAADAMDEADKLAEKGSYEKARAVLTKAESTIKKSRSQKDKYSQQLCEDITRASSGLQSARHYQSSGGKMLKMNKKAHAMQRSVQQSAYASHGAYSNVSKVSMMSKFKK